MQIIGEIAQAHNGCIGTAHAMIDAIAAAGAGAVKFQMRIDAEIDEREPWREQPSRWVTETRAGYWRRCMFSGPEWRGLRQHVDVVECDFVISVFSLGGLAAAVMLNPDAIKIPSGRIADLELIDAAAATGKPVYVSDGMATREEANDAYGVIAHSADSLIFICTSKYPTPPEFVKLARGVDPRVTGFFGLSDHSGTICPSIVAAWLGFRKAEVHICLSRECYGPDVPSSITTTELRELVAKVAFIERMRNSPVDVDALAEELKPMRDIFLTQAWKKNDEATEANLRGNHRAPKL